MKKSLYTSLLVCACVLGLWIRSEAAGTIDATSGASISVTGGTITDTSATIKWTETETNGVLRIYWDTVNVARGKQHDSVTVPNTTSTRGRAASYLISKKLKPGRKYFFTLYASESHGTYTTSSTFTTAASTTGLSSSPASLPKMARTPGVDLLGRKAGTGSGIYIHEKATQVETHQSSTSSKSAP